jgi:hypothetical protein
MRRRKSAFRRNCGPGKGINKVAREVGVGTGTVQRIKDEMQGPFDAAA